MFHSEHLPALNCLQRFTPVGAYPRSLTAIKGTPTPSYVLKLSSDPSHYGRCQRLQVSPQRPDAFLRPQQPTRAAFVTPFFSERPEARIHTGSQVNRVCLRYRSSRFRVAQHLHSADWVEGSMSASSARFSRASQSYPARS